MLIEEQIELAAEQVVTMMFMFPIAIWLTVGIALHFPCMRSTRIAAVIILLVLSLMISGTYPLAFGWTMVLSAIYLMTCEALTAAGR